MSVALSVSTEARLRHFRASEDVIQAASDLLDEREGEKLAMYLSELAEVDGSMPARIEGNAQLHEVNNLLARAATARKALEEVRVKRVAPLLAEQRAINELFGLLIDALKALDAKGKGAVVKWQEAEQEAIRREQEEQQRKARQAAELQRIAEERAAKSRSEAKRLQYQAEAQAQAALVETALAEVPREVPRGVRSEEGTTSIRQEWYLEAVMDATQVPRQYLDVNETRLRAAVHSGARDIPGCLISVRSVASVRTR